MTRKIKDGKIFCPQCATQMIWDTTEDRGEYHPETNTFEDDYTTIDYYRCPHCGMSVEMWQCLEGDKKNYDYWKDK